MGEIGSSGLAQALDLKPLSHKIAPTVSLNAKPYPCSRKDLLYLFRVPFYTSLERSVFGATGKTRNMEA